MYHVTHTREVETCRKSGLDHLVHFTYRKDAEKHAAKEQAKYEAQRAEAAAKRLRGGIEGKAKLDALVAAGEDIEPRSAYWAALDAFNWKASQEEIGNWDDAREAELNELMAKVQFRHERWLSGKYKVGSLDYEHRLVIYRRSHSKGTFGGVGAALDGEKGYKKLAALLLELKAATIDRRPRY